MSAFWRGFVLGAVAGAGAALVQAPRPGRETQAAIRAQFDAARGGLTGLAPDTARRQAGEWLERGVAAAEARRPELEETLVGLVTSTARLPAGAGGEAGRKTDAEVRQQVSALLDQVLALGRSWARQLKEEKSGWAESSSSC
jgi:gas vesicle protein